MRWKSGILYVMSLYCLIACCHNSSDNRFQGEVIYTIISSGDDLPRCAVEIWHQLLFVNNSSKAVCWSTGVRPDTCLSKVKMNQRLIINSNYVDEKTLDKMKTLYHDSIVFNLVIRGEKEIECITPRDSAFVTIGMYNRYNMDISMIDVLWMGFLNSDFVITSLGEIGGNYYFFRKSNDYKIKYLFNGSEVSEEEFRNREPEEYL